MIKKILILIIIFIFVGILYHFYGENNNYTKNLKIKNIDNKINNIEIIKNKQNSLKKYLGNIENKDFVRILGTGNVIKLKNNLKLGNYKETIKSIDLITSKLHNNSKLNDEQKIIKATLEYIKLGAILNIGNYYYKEKSSQLKTNIIIKNIKSIDTDLADNFYGNYYLGYSNEINKQYKEALKYYDKALKYTYEDKELKSVILNQIGHLYDLQGKSNKAYEYYAKAYNLDKLNYESSNNIARYLLSIGKNKLSKKYLVYSLNTPNLKLKSELSYSLSILEYLSGNIGSGIDYAKKSIYYNNDYPMGYYALAKGYYILDLAKYYSKIKSLLKKSISLYEHNSQAYELLALSNFDNKLFAILALLEKAKLEVDKDVLILGKQKIILKNKITYEQYLVKLIKTSYIKKLPKTSIPYSLWFQEKYRKNTGIFSGIILY